MMGPSAELSKPPQRIHVSRSANSPHNVRNLISRSIGAALSISLALFSVVAIWFLTIYAARTRRITFAYKFGDFLINYSDGFVRRGALGTVLRYFAHGHSILLATSIYVFGTFIALVLALIFLVLAKSRRRVATFLLISLMPGGFVMMSITGDFVFRKEFGFLAALAIFACGYVLVSRISNTKLRAACSRFAIACALVVSLFAVLTHEAFVFLVAPAFSYLLAGFARYTNIRRPGRVPLFYMLSMVLLFGVLGVFFHGTAAQARQIWQNADPLDRAQIAGSSSLNAIGLSGRWQLLLTIAIADSGYVWWYIGPLVLIALYCFLIVCLNENERPTVTSWTRCFFVILAATVPMFILGSDWGRWIVCIEYSFLIVWLAMGSQTLASFDLLKGYSCDSTFKFLESTIRRTVRKRPAAVFWALLVFALTFKLPEIFLSFDYYTNGPLGFIGASIYRTIHLFHGGRPMP